MTKILVNEGCDFMVWRDSSIQRCKAPRVFYEGKALDFCQEHVLYLGSFSGAVVSRPQIELFESEAKNVKNPD